MEKVYIERGLEERSVHALWQLISTAEGMTLWMADRVIGHDGRLQFTWGNPLGEHHTQTATVMDQKKRKFFRFHWDGEEDDTFVEMRIERSELTEDLTLCVTDFSNDGESEDLKALWEEDFDRLRQNTGF